MLSCLLTLAACSFSAFSAFSSSFFFARNAASSSSYSFGPFFACVWAATLSAASDEGAASDDGRRRELRDGGTHSTRTEKNEGLPASGAWPCRPLYLQGRRGAAIPRR